jgi:heptosyltransferase-2
VELLDKLSALRFSSQSSAFSGGGTIGTSTSGAPKPNSLVASNMNVLIIKLGAAGDVVRTTTLLRRLGDQITWLTEAKNTVLLEGVKEGLKCVCWEQRNQTKGTLYDLVINLEDTQEIGSFLKLLEYKQLFGAYLDSGNSLRYTDDSRPWFDLSILSRYGKQQADQLKYENRRTYQELVFEGLGWRFEGERYCLPEPTNPGLKGDVAIAPQAGLIWPMKHWAYYDDLERALKRNGLIVNVLPKRSSLLEHLGDVSNHRCLVSGDTLPMHLALASQVRCVSLFTCTSPWEIHDYGLQRKLVSPLIKEFFYKRGFAERATSAIPLEDVIAAVLEQLDAASKPERHAVGVISMAE